MLVEVWSDVVCPWCYLGKRRLEAALTSAGVEADVAWRSFQLDPAASGRAPVYEMLAAKTGGSPEDVRAMTAHVAELAAAEGLAYDFEHAVSVNTFDAHRLAHHAAAHGLGPEMAERLFRAHLCEGLVVDDPAVLATLASDVGVPPVEDGAYADEVRADIAMARRLGASGVPFFVIDRKYGVSGAQPVETFVRALERAAQPA